MDHPDREGFGSKLSKNPIVVIISLIASGIALIAFITNKQSIQDFVFGDKTVVPQPSPTLDLSNLYTYFPSPNIGLTKTYNYSYVYAQYDENVKVTGQKTENGSYSETVTIVNQDFISNNITIIGVEIKGNDYLTRCKNNFYWVVYDRQRLYIICSKDYVFNAAAEMAHNPATYLKANSQYSSSQLDLGPEYFAPFDIGKYWNSNKYDMPNMHEVSVAGNVAKTISLGTYDNCFQFRFWAVNYNELRYLCPNVGLVAIEVYDHDDYYSAELVSIK